MHATKLVVVFATALLTQMSFASSGYAQSPKANYRTASQLANDCTVDKSLDIAEEAIGVDRCVAYFDGLIGGLEYVCKVEREVAKISRELDGSESVADESCDYEELTRDPKGLVSGFIDYVNKHPESKNDYALSAILSSAPTPDLGKGETERKGPLPPRNPGETTDEYLARIGL